jgi:iron complex outermembrane recepter protein
VRILTPLALAVASATTYAQQPPMEHVLVSVPLHKTSAETALPVTVLSGDELRRAASATIGETLGQSPGLASASFGPGVGQPVIRGQQGPRVTVLQNGTSSADVAGLSGDHAVSVEALLADSIEILRGPSTLLYGGGAIGGVVNVLDNRIPTSLEEGVSGGLEYRHDTASDLDNIVGRADGSSGSFAWHADFLYRDYNDLDIPGEAARERGDEHEGEEHGDEEHDGEEHGDEETTDGYIGNTAGRAKSLTVGGAYHFDDGFFGLAVNRLENAYGIPSGAHEHGDEEEGHEDHDHEGEEHEGEEHSEGEEEEGGVKLDIEQTRYDAALHWHEPIPAFEVMRGFLTYTDYEHAEIEGSGEVGTEFSNETWEGRLEMVHQQVGGFHGVLGLQVSSGEFSAVGEEAYIPETESSQWGVFVVEDYHAGDWLFELGLRFDQIDRDPDIGADEDFNAISASGSALWDVSSGWQLGLALSRSERAPAVEELYSNAGNVGPGDWVEHAATGSIELGDPGLDTETSNNADLSVRWSGDGHWLDLTVFYNDFADYINLLNSGQALDETPVLVYAQEDAEFYGVEFDSEFTLASLGGGELRAGIWGDYIRGELDSGDDIPRLPPMRLGARLAWASESLELWTRVMDVDEQDKPGANEEPTDSYTKWDAGADYRLPVAGSEVTLFLALNNITDEEIRLSTSFLRDVAPESGFSVEAGVRWTF